VSNSWATLHYRQSLASRVTLLTTMAVGFAVTAVAVAAYATVRTQTMSALDNSLRDRATAVAQMPDLAQLTNMKIPSEFMGAAQVQIISLDTSTSPPLATIAGSPSSSFVGTPEIDVANGVSQQSARTDVVDGNRYRVVAVHVDHDQALILAESLNPTDQLLSRLGLVMLLFGIVGVIVAGFAGWAVARSGLRPVRRLTRAVEDIARTERLDPIPIEGNDEVARLSYAFNAMLTALSASQHRQRQLVADAGHELRTPLTSLRTNLDLLVQADKGAGLSVESRNELLDDVRAQISEMTTLIGDLVELARDEPITTQVEPVELAAVVGQAVTRVRRRAATVSFDVQLQPWWVTGDSSALERAVTNLLDNAVKWSPDGGIVTVHLGEGTLLVGDQGKGISSADMPHVFDRFYRSAESRGMSGSGLGLSIVRAVAERHGGIVRAGTGPRGGAGFWFSVPGSPAPPEVLARS
jgi:two-component system sensor histidine kinase MprB